MLSAQFVVFWEGGLCKHSFTANSIKALGAVLIGRLYFWLSSSPVLLPLRKGSAANVKLCDNRAIRHSTEFDPATSRHDGCEMIPSPPAQHDTLSTTQIHSAALPLSFSHVPCLLLHLLLLFLSLSVPVTLQTDSMLYAFYLKLVRSGDSPKQMSPVDYVLYHLSFSPLFWLSLLGDKCSCFPMIAFICDSNQNLQDSQITANTRSLCALSVCELCVILAASGGLPAYGKSKWANLHFLYFAQ